MRIAVIGGGFTGLTAAYELTKRGHTVTVFERDDHIGGLAWGFKRANWDWYLEAAYHHLFTNDNAIIGLIKELGLGDKLIIKRPITANLLPSFVIPGLTRNPSLSKTGSRLGGRDDTARIVQLDSPLHLLQFPGLSMVDKLKTGALAAFCKLYPFWQTLEGVTAKHFFTAVGGKKAWEVIWEPLMTGKFGHLDDTIAASWLWARIHKRTPSLAYIEGGFQTLVEALQKAIIDRGGNILLSTSVGSITKSLNDKPVNLPAGKAGLQTQYKKRKNHLSFNICHLTFDAVLLTLPTPIAVKIVPDLAFGISHLTLSIPHLHAQILILETKEPILNDVYWLSITDRSFPFLAVVAHTNFMDKKHYGGHHLTYIGNYLPDGHQFLKLTKEQLLKKFLPYIKRLNPSFNLSFGIYRLTLFNGPFAQPVHQLHYSRRAPKLETGIPNVFLANMDSIYPWDRGTNYAVELGQKAASVIQRI